MYMAEPKEKSVMVRDASLEAVSAVTPVRSSSRAPRERT